MWAIAAAFVLGAAWRRWWGSDTRDARGLRMIQACAGIALLFALCLWAGDPWWLAALKTVVTMGLLTERAFSIPIVWEGWRLASTKIAWLRDKWTAASELTAGGVTWALAVGL